MKTRYVSATEVQARDLGTLELPSPFLDLAQPMSGLWNLLSSDQMTAGEGKAFTTSFDLQAHSDTPDLLSSALTYHLLTCRLKILRRCQKVVFCLPADPLQKMRWTTLQSACLIVENTCSSPMWWITWCCNTTGEMFSASAGGQSWCLMLLCFFSLCTVVLQRGWNLVCYTHCLRSWHINVVKEMIILLPWRVFGTSSR